MGYLQEHLAELLQEHDCVIIPDFGGFVGNKHAAEINERTEIINPAFKKISFNARLFHNDGVFAQDMRLRNNVSYQDAMAQIDGEVRWINRQLDAGKSVSFKGVGVLYKNSAGKLAFNSAQDDNLLLSSFGLAPVSLHKVETEALPEKVVVAATVAPKESVGGEEILIVDGNSTQSKRRRSLRNLAAAAVLPLFIAATYWAGADNQTTEFGLFNSSPAIESDYQPRFEEESAVIADPLEGNSLETHIANHTDKEAIYYSFEKEEISPDGVKINLNSTAPEVPVVDIEETNTALNLFFIVGGAFREKSNAKDYVKQLQNKGYDASIFGMKGDLHLVSFGSYVSESSARQALETIRDKDNPYAWLKKQ